MGHEPEQEDYTFHLTGQSFSELISVSLKFKASNYYIYTYLVRKFNTSLSTFSQIDATRGNWNIPRNCAGDFPEFITTYLKLDHTFLASSYNHSFHFTALTATHHGVQTSLENKGLIKPTEKLFTNIGTTFSHAIIDHTLFLCIINTEKCWKCRTQLSN